MTELPPYLAGVLAILLLSAFAKIATALSILRVGLGLGGAGFGVVVMLLAFVLSVFTLAPQLGTEDPLAMLLSGTPQKTSELVTKLQPFIKRNTDPEVEQRFARLARKLREGEAPEQTEAAQEERIEAISLSTSAGAFLVTELREAFQIGFILLLPFFVLDILVLNVLLSLNVTQIGAQAVALPLKLILFFDIDGWSLLTEKLLGSYV